MIDPSVRFGANAEKYGSNKNHNNIAEFERLAEFARPLPTDDLLDVATGAGNVALFFAAYVRSVVALDVTIPMLEQVEKRAKAAGLNNVTLSHSIAEKLPFPDHSFDIVTLRLALHHFDDPVAAITEISRVLKPGGRFVFVDSIAPDDDELDAEINELEVLRDPSHRRSFRAKELREMIKRAGMEVVTETILKEWDGDEPLMDFQAWVDRVDAPKENRSILRSRFEHASQALRDEMLITIYDGSIQFSIPRVEFLAKKA